MSDFFTFVSFVSLFRFFGWLKSWIVRINEVCKWHLYDLWNMIFCSISKGWWKCAWKCHIFIFNNTKGMCNNFKVNQLSHGNVLSKCIWQENRNGISVQRMLSLIPLSRGVSTLYVAYCQCIHLVLCCIQCKSKQGT